MIHVETKLETHNVRLSEDEIIKKARDNTQRLGELALEREDFKARAAKAKKDFDIKEEEIRTQLSYVARGEEPAQVEVGTYHDFKANGGKGEVLFIREDTQEVLRRRPMNDFDRQLSLVEGGASVSSVS